TPALAINQYFFVTRLHTYRWSIPLILWGALDDSTNMAEPAGLGRSYTAWRGGNGQAATDFNSGRSVLFQSYCSRAFRGVGRSSLYDRLHAFRLRLAVGLGCCQRSPGYRHRV